MYFKSITVVLIFITSLSFSQSCSIATWNIANFGASKDESEITFIAKTIKDFDILAIQEISVSPPGPQAVARLIDALNRTGSKWDYAISDPTVGNGCERYAFVWKTSRVRLLGKPWLEKSMEQTIDREPFLARFICNINDTFLMATIHTVPTKKLPQNECIQLYMLDSIYEKDHLIILGDFNLSHKSPAFDNMKARKIKPAFEKQKTTLKMKMAANGEVLANEYDNIFYESDEIQIKDKGFLNFSTSFPDLKSARSISDHIPLFIYK
ncbi:MAG: hypothetical protein A3F72_19330 [Bacteroidetes bacterium RIFCSPLOWO2_12_FULL_35_15]|nr:MAG: hypothetical protein A3F72_19330 [Bacteroidetes bacterium RIFCSPLOWO2_12_FULL_35_15]